MTADNPILIWGVIAGLLQALGYVLYIRDENIDPNPVTWFMFAYGTGILTLLEWDTGASPALLGLPAICAVLAIYVAFKCWRKARIRNPMKWWPEDWWPEDHYEQASFVIDVIITIGYVTAWILAVTTLLPEEGRYLASLGFLFLSNVSTFPAFYPLLNETCKTPHKEHWLPWTIWTIAYICLAVATYLEVGTFWHSLMFYPLSNVFLHGLVGYIARPQKRMQRE